MTTIRYAATARRLEEALADVEETARGEVTFHVDVGLLARHVFWRTIETNRARGLAIEVDTGPGFIERRYFVTVRGMWLQIRTFLRVIGSFGEQP